VFSNTLSFLYSRNVSDHVSHGNVTTILSYFLSTG
jgi:hypothetical protein